MGKEFEIQTVMYEIKFVVGDACKFEHSDESILKITLRSSWTVRNLLLAKILINFQKPRLDEVRVFRLKHFWNNSN